jgi:hypothetical protein
MRFYISLFFCVVLLFGCAEKEDTPPQYIQMHNMAMLLTDIHIIDGSLYSVPQSPDSLTKHGLGFYLGVFKAHRTDSTQFKKSMQYYTTRPDKFAIIYGRVTSNLKEKLDSLTKLKPKVNQDSLQKAKTKQTADSIQKVRTSKKADSLHIVEVLKKAKAVKKIKSKG